MVRVGAKTSSCLPPFVYTACLILRTFTPLIYRLPLSTALVLVQAGKSSRQIIPGFLNRFIHHTPGSEYKMAAFTRPFDPLPYDLPCYADGNPIPTANDQLTRRLQQAYGLDEQDGVPEFLWRENIDCIAQGTTRRALLKRPRWGECKLSISYTVYERIRPALRRVGAMMAMSEAFFAKILFADVKTFADPALYGWDYLDANYKTPTEEEREILARTIEGLRSSLRFFMGQDEKSGCHHGRASGRLGFSGSSTFYRLDVAIRPAYLLFFSNPEYDSVDEETKNTVLFSLAATILHEMAHSFWQVRRAWTRIKIIEDGTYLTMHSPCKPQPEPLTEMGVPHRELGRSWESFFFGGFPEMRGDIDDPEAENPLMYATGTQLHGWQTLLRANVGPDVQEGPFDDCVHAFFDDEIFNLVLKVLHARTSTTEGKLENLTFHEVMEMAHRIGCEE